MPIETLSVFDGSPAATDHPGPVAVPYGPGLATDEVVASAREAGLTLPVSDLLAGYAAKGEPGEIVEVPVSRGGGVARVLLYGVGDGTAEGFRTAGAAVARRVRGCEELTLRLPEQGPWAALAEGALLGSYVFTLATERAASSRPVGGIRFTGPEAAREQVGRAGVLARATALARDLANTPSSVKSPEWLAGRAVEIAAETGLTAEVWTPDRLRAEGFGGILAVGQGSARPPRLIKLTYEPAHSSGGARHVVLVGKGITFDSGGLSLKPTDNMKLQKTDMAGGGAVIAAMSALRELGATVRVTGLIAAAENMPSGGAQRPGDVITHYGGRTVEVLNTDAEGRLVLADALAYANAALAPDEVIDIATLTGAAPMALGRRYGALFATSDDLAAALAAAGEASGDLLWRMPLIEDYRPAVKSTVADLANVEKGGTYGAGSITAALFLREFAGPRSWAHLDIAGVGRSLTDEGIHTKGATGFGARLLLTHLTA